MFFYITLVYSGAVARVVSAFTTWDLLSTISGKYPVFTGTGKDRMGEMALHRDVQRDPAKIKRQTPTRAAGELGGLVHQVSCG